MARGTICLLTVVSALVAGSPLRSAGTTAEVPFELYQHHLVVTKGSIGQLTDLNLLIDTAQFQAWWTLESAGSCTRRLNHRFSSLSAIRCESRAGLWMDSASVLCTRTPFPSEWPICRTWKASESTPSSGSTCCRARASASTIGPGW